MNTDLCNLCNEKFDETELIHFSLCNHSFCLNCLRKHLTENLQSEMACPVVNCNESIADKIIREILNAEQIEKYEQMCLNNIPNMYRCILPECGREMIFEDSNVQYECSFCTLYNCVKCKEAHKYLSCETFNLTRNSTGRKTCEDELNRAKKILMENKAKECRNLIVTALSGTVVPNPDIFNCPVCNEIIQKREGIQLLKCFHNICKICLNRHVMSNLDIPTPCPIQPCNFPLEDVESRAFLNEKEMSIYEHLTIKKAAPSFNKPARCQKPDCPNMVDITGDLTEWTCQICKNVNCLKCNAIHTGERCLDTNTDDKIEEMIRNKKLMRCPVCKTIIQKKGGCNLIKCSGCGTDLCWMLQTKRWGPGGPGDQTGGCKCGLNGKKCHPECYSGCIPDGYVRYYPRNPEYRICIIL